MKKLIRKFLNKPPDKKAPEEDIVSSIINHYLENDGRGWFRPVRIEG